MSRSFSSRAWPVCLPALMLAAPARAQQPPPPPPEPPPAAPAPVEPAPPPAPAVPQVPVPNAYVPPPYVPPAYGPAPVTMGDTPRPPAPAADTAKPSTLSGNWYGWQTLIAIAPFDIAMFSGLATNSSTAGLATFYTGFIGRGLAASVVHMAHSNWGKAFGTIGLHVGASAAGLAIAYGIAIARTPACPPLAACRNNFEGVPSGIVYGAIAGSMTATVLDTVFLAYREKLAWTASVPPGGSPGITRARGTWAFAPYVAPEPGGRRGGVAATGSF